MSGHRSATSLPKAILRSVPIARSLPVAQCRSYADTPPSDQRNIYQGAGLLNYAAQQRYLSQSRVCGMLAAVALLGIAAAGVVTGQNFKTSTCETGFITLSASPRVFVTAFTEYP